MMQHDLKFNIFKVLVIYLFGKDKRNLLCTLCMGDNVLNRRQCNFMEAVSDFHPSVDIDAN